MKQLNTNSHDLIASYEKLIYKVTHEFAKRRGYNIAPYDIEDLKQEAVLIVLNSLESYDPSRGKISTYITLKINSNLKDLLRKQRINDTPSDLSLLENKLVYTQSNLDPEVINLTKKINSLSPKDKAIIDLRLNGFSWVDISKKLNLSITVLGRKKLRIQKILLP